MPTLANSLTGVVHLVEGKLVALRWRLCAARVKVGVEMIGLAVRSVLGQYATFSGRASRAEYWWYSLASAVSLIALSYLLGGSRLGAVLIIMVDLALLVPGLAVTVRRLHDTGRSGGWIFVALVPFAGAIVLIVMMALRGEPGDNGYGPPHPLE